MDDTQTLVNVNLLMCPMFDVDVIQEDETRFEYVDIDGVRRVFLKEQATIPKPRLSACAGRLSARLLQHFGAPDGL
jgi:hypothetical protein